MAERDDRSGTVFTPMERMPTLREVDEFKSNVKSDVKTVRALILDLSQRVSLIQDRLAQLEGWKVGFNEFQHRTLDAVRLDVVELKKTSTTLLEQLNTDRVAGVETKLKVRVLWALALAGGASLTIDAVKFLQALGS